MINKLEYVKFVMLITIKSNIMLLESYIKSCLFFIDQIKDFNPEGVKRNDERIAECRTQINYTYALLNRLYAINNIEELDKLISIKWPSILKGLLNGKYDYRWELKDFKVEVNDEISEQVNEHYEILYNERIRKNTRYYYDTPLYIDVMTIVRLDANINEVYKGIYSDMINNGLFDPNMNRSYSSSEFFWTSLPEPFKYGRDSNYFADLNKKVIFDKRTNYYLLGNGSDELEWLIRRTSESYDKTHTLTPEDRYSLDIVSYVFKNNDCSLLDKYRSNGNWQTESQSYIDILFNQMECFYRTDLSDILDLREYCLSRECINKQIAIAKYPSPKRNYTIDRYIQLITERHNNSLGEEVKKLVKLKV